MKGYVVKLTPSRYKVRYLIFSWFILIWLFLRPQKNEGTLWRQHCDVFCPWQNAATLLCSVQTQQMFLKIFRNFFLCQTQMLHTWQNESTFGKHDHISNVAATMCPRFAGALVTQHALHNQWHEAVVLLNVPLEDVNTRPKHSLKPLPVQLDTLQCPPGLDSRCTRSIQHQSNLTCWRKVKQSHSCLLSNVHAWIELLEGTW